MKNTKKKQKNVRYLIQVVFGVICCLGKYLFFVNSMLVGHNNKHCLRRHNPSHVSIVLTKNSNVFIESQTRIINQDPNQLKRED